MASEAHDPASSSASPRGVLLVLLLSFLVYLPSVGNDFAMDDEPLVSSKWVLREGQPDPVIATLSWPWEYFKHHYWDAETNNDGLYRPITIFSYALTYNWISKPFLPPEWEARPHHAINVLLHVWATYLVILLLTQLGVDGFRSLLTAALFGLHAIHSEVVAGIVGRAELFSFCLGAQAIYLVARGLEASSVGKAWRLCLATFLMFLAYGSKESSLNWIPFLPCYLLVRHWLRHPGIERPAFEPLKPAHLGHMALVMLPPFALFLGLRWQVMSESVPYYVADYSSNPLGQVALDVRLLTAIKVWGYGFYKCLAPYSLCCLYSPEVFALVESPADPGFVVSLVLLGAFLYSGLRYARAQPLLFLAMALYLGFSFLTSNVPLAIGTIFAERLYYIASLGVCLLPAVLLPRLSTFWRRALLGLLGLWMAGSSVVILERNAVWKDSASLFLSDVQVHPEAIDLHRKAAVILSREGPLQDLSKAEAHLRRALEILPNYAHAWRQLGQLYAQREQWQQAYDSYRKAFGQGYVEPEGAEGIAYNNAGKMLANMDRHREAIDWWKKTLTLPAFGDTHKDAYAYLADNGPGILTPGELQRIYVEGKKLAKDPDVKLVLSLALLGYKIGVARQEVFQALNWALANYPEEGRGKETFLQAHLFLADILAEMGQVDRAKRIYQDLLENAKFPAELKPKVAEAIRKLGR